MGTVATAQNRSKPPAKGKATVEVNGLGRDLNQLLDGVEHLLSDAKQLSGEGASLARATLLEKVSDAREKLDAALGTAGEMGEQAVVDSREYVGKHPLKALCIAAAAGAALGLLLTRRL